MRVGCFEEQNLLGTSFKSEIKGRYLHENWWMLKFNLYLLGMINKEIKNNVENPIKQNNKTIVTSKFLMLMKVKSVRANAYLPNFLPSL